MRAAERVAKNRTAVREGSGFVWNESSRKLEGCWCMAGSAARGCCSVAQHRLRSATAPRRGQVARGARGNAALTRSLAPAPLPEGALPSAPPEERLVRSSAALCAVQLERSGALQHGIALLLQLVHQPHVARGDDAPLLQSRDGCGQSTFRGQPERSSGKCSPFSPTTSQGGLGVSCGRPPRGQAAHYGRNRCYSHAC